MDRKRYSRPELLAPAGDLARAKTAIRFGADAVYLGGQRFSLRSRASNFTMDQIAEACSFAKAHGARIHVTVNEIPHEEDFDGLEDYLRQLQSVGVTAIIVASPAIMKLAHRCAPGLEVHCSTQMSVTNSATAQLLQDTLSIDRVVLARECSMEQIKEITKNCPIETEAFIHGGMCVNISGRCTLSNRMTNRDANRGGCAQSCRWAYHVFDGEQEISTNDQLFTMGSKDLSACAYLADLMEAGVSSLKIEGRMKTEYYVASIVSAYRHAIDEIYNAQSPLSAERMAYHRAQVMKAENRETCTGFYAGTAGADSIIQHGGASQDVSHGYLGTVLSYDADTKTARIQVRNPLDVQDRIEVLEPGQNNRVFELMWMKNERGEYQEKNRVPMKILTIPVPFEVEAEDILRKADL